jgi:hypothetical protein
MNKQQADLLQQIINQMSDEDILKLKTFLSSDNMNQVYNDNNLFIQRIMFVDDTCYGCSMANHSITIPKRTISAYSLCTVSNCTFRYKYTIKDKCVNVICQECNKTFSLNVNSLDFMAWKIYGQFIQTAFPYLTADERELLISSYCGDCFDKLFTNVE